MKEIEIDQLEVALARGERLIDVREPGEYSEGHVPGALSIPLGQVPDRVDECVEAGRTTYVICRSGARSANACEFLSDRGHDVVNVIGGTMAWVASGRDTVEGNSPQ